MTKRNELSAYICGSVNCGKTTKCIQIMKRYYKYYDVVFVFKTTQDFEEYEEHFGDEENFIISFFDEKKFNALIDAKRKKRRFKELRYLVVFDDCLGYMKKKTLERVFFAYRHLKTSLIFTSQSYKALTNTVRNNLTIIYFMKQIDENFFEFFVKNIKNDPAMIKYFKNTKHPQIIYYPLTGILIK